MQRQCRDNAETMQFHSALRRSALEADRDEYKRLYEKCLGEKR